MRVRTPGDRSKRKEGDVASRPASWPGEDPTDAVAAVMIACEFVDSPGGPFL
jgi:hypothetical protein